MRAPTARRSSSHRCTAAAPRSSAPTRSAIFDEAAGLTDLAGAHWLRDARDSGDELEDTGYVEDADGEGFRYLRTAGAIRRGRY